MRKAKPEPVLSCPSSPRCLDARLRSQRKHVFVQPAAYGTEQKHAHPAPLNSARKQSSTLTLFIQMNIFPMQTARRGLFISFTSDGAGYIQRSVCPWDSPYSSNRSIQTGLSAHWVVLYGRHMTASVRYRETVVKNKRLLLKARPRSAASLVGRGGRRRVVLPVSQMFWCVEQHVGRFGGARKQSCDLLSW